MKGATTNCLNDTLPKDMSAQNSTMVAHDIYHNDTWNNRLDIDIQHKDTMYNAKFRIYMLSVIMLSVTFSYCYAEYHIFLLLC